MQQKDFERMGSTFRWFATGAVLLALGGCAAEGPLRAVVLEQKIEAARTGEDHSEIASIYERLADADKESADRHLNLARAYERGWVWAAPRVGGTASARKENRSFVEHCENLARIHRQAAAENSALAAAHRRLGAESRS